MNRSDSKRTDRARLSSGRRWRDNANASGPFRRRWRVWGAAAIAVGCLFALAYAVSPVFDRTPVSRGAGLRQASTVQIPQVRFTDITRDAGIAFVHENGARGRKLLPETMGGGCAFLDFDSDGDQDLLFVNSQPWPESPQEAAPTPTMALYRNDGRGRFEDATPGSGLDLSLYGMGAAVGDYDNDGRVDLFLSAVGGNRLFHNEGDGRFVEVTRDAGVHGGSDQWSTGCGWFDYDNDGDLDLFVCNYLKWTAEHDAAQSFRLPGGAPAYGRPQNFIGAFPSLYRNDGNGSFTDVSDRCGIQISDPATGAPLSKSLGLTFGDFNRDGWLDVFVANDTVQNQLFRNRGDGTFDEIGALAGVAFDSNGNARGAMGVDSAHLHNDDALGIAIGNFSNEMMAMYIANVGALQFKDEASAVGLGPSTRLELTFGTCFVDYDLDGALDLFAANGHLEPEINRVQPSQKYAQPPQLFWNGGEAGGGKLMPVSSRQSGADFAQPMVGRGASFADIDGDGDLDLLITANGRAPRLLRNDQELRNHWLRLKLVGATCNRDAVGAEVEVRLQGRTLRRSVMPTRSYLSQVELPLTFGLGKDRRVESVTIRWPDGSRQIVRDLQVDRSYRIEQGAKGTPSSTAPLPEAVSAPIVEHSPGGRRASLVAGGAGETCGNYLHLSDAAPLAELRTPGLPQPCRGPLCSNEPIERRAPPPSLNRLSQPQQDLLARAVRPPALPQACGRALPDSNALAHFASGRIFRPPRHC